MFDGRTTVASMSAERTETDFVPSASPNGPELPDMSGSYDRYISSGLYDRRYPRPNRRTLGIMKRCLPAGGRFLDVGAGTGRYTLPLLRVDGASGLALDICPVARKTLAERFGEFVRAERLLIRGEDADTVALDHPQAFDLALLAFGVLAHVAGRAERLRLLRAIRAMLKPDGTLVLSVPNARRRFRAEQLAAAPLVQGGRLEPGDVLYKRGQDNGEIPMFYHVYTLAEVQRDLSEAGFQVKSVGAESLLSETAVVSNRFVGWLDAMACRLAPASLGYDLLAVAKP
ncbi:MAG: class I SAM-dependent methyltransferase [Rhodospirillales bacterium]|nr:class I SAM-dependent methyltransferase [Rhodospirillales bacterium]MDE0378399.1 class I SAM-dependent methyltransferase [Rhodospirillales bacterium]